MLRPLAIVQARSGSSRLPGKVLMALGDLTVLEYVLARCRMSRNLAGVVLATTTLPGDDRVAALAEKSGVPVFRGSEDDVLERYIQAAHWAGGNLIVRITADCPLIDPGLIDRTIEAYWAAPADYVHIAGYPNGVGAVEVLRLAALERAFRETRQEDVYYREHVMTYLTDHPELFAVRILKAPAGLARPDVRLCVDETPDLEVIRMVADHFYPRIDFSCQEIVSFLDDNKWITKINSHVRQKGRDDTAVSSSFL